MKIAVAVMKKGESSTISDQPGRSAFFLLFDEQGRLLETLKNPFSRGGGGAGFGVAKMADVKTAARLLLALHQLHSRGTAG